MRVQLGALGLHRCPVDGLADDERGMVVALRGIERATARRMLEGGCGPERRFAFDGVADVGWLDAAAGAGAFDGAQIEAALRGEAARDR